MKFLTMNPFSTGVHPSYIRRNDYLSLVMSTLSFHNLDAVLILLRETPLGYEWRIYSLNKASILFTREARKDHARMRRKEKFRLMISVVVTVNGNKLEQAFSKPENYLSFLGKIKKENHKIKI